MEQDPIVGNASEALIMAYDPFVTVLDTEAVVRSLAQESITVEGQAKPPVDPALEGQFASFIMHDSPVY